MSDDIYYIGHKTRVHINNKIQSTFRHWANCSRYAYNYALNLQLIEESLHGKIKLKHLADYDKYFNAGKYPLGFVRKTKSQPLVGSGQHEWLQGVPSSVTQIPIKIDLKAAWQRLFKGLGQRPRFKRKNSRISFTLSNTDLKMQALGKRIILPKHIGQATLADLPDWFEKAEKLSFTTFSYQAGKWYCAFIMAVPSDVYFKHTPFKKKPIVGVDAGVAEYAVTSERERFQFPKQKLKKLQKKIEDLQRQLDKHLIRSAKVIIKNCKTCDREYRGRNEIRYYCESCRDAIRLPSKREKKMREHIAVLKNKQMNLRKQAAENTSLSLAQRYDRVVFENLAIQKMSQSAKGDVDNHGENVSLQAMFNRELLNMGLYDLRHKTQIKCDRYGGEYIAIEPLYTNQECNKCGFINDVKKPQFICQQCGYEDDAYVNSAKNIVKRAQKNC